MQAGGDAGSLSGVSMDAASTIKVDDTINEKRMHSIRKTRPSLMRRFLK